MDSETFSGLLLTTERLIEILAEMDVAYVKSVNQYTHFPILPAFKKLGVLVDLDEFVEDKGTKTTINKKNGANVKAQSSQSYNCIQCRRHLPTAHLLDLHITEQHDLYFTASVERGDKPLYSCYIEECAVKFHVPRERKDHCITVHKFPANYRFDQEKVSQFKGRKNKKADADAMDVDNGTASNVLKLPYIKAFSFGHPTQRTFSTRKERGSGKELLDLNKMKEALEDMD